MTVKELIVELLRHPMDKEVYVAAGSDPRANLKLDKVRQDVTYARNEDAYGGCDQVVVILDWKGRNG